MIIRASSLTNECIRRSFASAYPKLCTEKGYEIRRKGQLISGLVGTAVHKGCEMIVKAKIEGKSYNAANVIILAYESLKADGQIKYDATTPTMQHAKEQVDVLIHFFNGHSVSPRQPTHSEQFLEMPLKGTDYTLSGHVDIISQDAIYDIKTGKNAESSQAQLGAYCLLAKYNKICIPRKAIIIHLPKKKDMSKHPGPKLFEYDADMCIEVAKQLIKDRVKYLDDFRKTGDPNKLPANPASTLCGKTYCNVCKTEFCRLKG